MESPPEQYLKDLQKQSFWGGCLEIIAAAKILSCNVIVVNDKLDIQIFYYGYKSNKYIAHLGGTHYEILEPIIIDEDMKIKDKNFLIGFDQLLRADCGEQGYKYIEHPLIADSTNSLLQKTIKDAEKRANEVKEKRQKRKESREKAKEKKKKIKMELLNENNYQFLLHRTNAASLDFCKTKIRSLFALGKYKRMSQFMEDLKRIHTCNEVANDTDSEGIFYVSKKDIKEIIIQKYMHRLEDIPSNFFSNNISLFDNKLLGVICTALECNYLFINDINNLFFQDNNKNNTMVVAFDKLTNKYFIVIFGSKTIEMAREDTLDGIIKNEFKYMKIAYLPANIKNKLFSILDSNQRKAFNVIENKLLISPDLINKYVKLIVKNEKELSSIMGLPYYIEIKDLSCRVTEDQSIRDEANTILNDMADKFLTGNVVLTIRTGKTLKHMMSGLRNTIINSVDDDKLDDLIEWCNVISMFLNEVKYVETSNDQWVGEKMQDMINILYDYHEKECTIKERRKMKSRRRSPDR